MGRCLYREMGMSKAEFRNYLSDLVEEDTSIPEIARICHVSSAAIHNWLKMFNLSRRKNLRDSAWLFNEYIIKKRSSANIAKECNVTYQAVLWYLNKFNIPKRTFAEAQRNRNRKLEKPNGFHFLLDKTRPHSYCFWWNDIYFASTAEYIFYKMNHAKYNILSQPFIFENRRPDFLLDKKTVVEIKCERRRISNDDLIVYQKLGENIKKSLGYDYEIRFMKDEYPKEYYCALSWLRTNANIGNVFCLMEEI